MGDGYAGRPRPGESWNLRFPFGELRIVLDGGVLQWGFDEARGEAGQVEGRMVQAGQVIEVDDVEGFTLGFPYRRRPITDPATASLAACFDDL